MKRPTPVVLIIGMDASPAVDPCDAVVPSLRCHPFPRHLLGVSPGILHSGQVFRLGHDAAGMLHVNQDVVENCV